MQNELLILRFPDLHPWERDLFAPVLAELGVRASVRVIDVTADERSLLRTEAARCPCWVLARDWRRAVRFLAPRASSRLFVSVLELGSPARSLSTLFVKRFAAGLPQGVRLLTYSPLNFRFFREIEGHAGERVEAMALGLPATGGVTMPRESGRFTVGSFGAFASGSNFHFLLNVAHYVCRRNPAAHFSLLGKGPLGRHLSSIVRDLELEGRVSIVESATAAELSAMDVFLYTPLRNDHFGPLLSAAAHGVASLTSEVPGIEELVTDGADGFVLPVNETKPMGELVLRLLEAPALRESLAARLAASLAAKYSTEALAARYASLFFGGASAAARVSAVA